MPPLLADIFLYSHEADFIQSLLSTGKKQLASRFYLTYRYIDDVLPINNPEFEKLSGSDVSCWTWDQGHHSEHHFCFYLDLLLSIVRDGQLHTSIYDKRDDFNFHITNLPFLSSYIPSSPVYGVFISQLIRYSRACSSYECFGQGDFPVNRDTSWNARNRHSGSFMVDTGILFSNMLNDILTLDQQWFPHRSDFPPI